MIKFIKKLFCSHSWEEQDRRELLFPKNKLTQFEIFLVYQCGYLLYKCRKCEKLNIKARNVPMYMDIPPA